MYTASIDHRRRVILYAVIAVVILGVLSMYLYLIYARTPQARSRQKQAVPIVGTWVGEKGNVLNIRPDGTARFRWRKHPRDIGYFEWTFDSREFRIYQYAKKHNLGWFVRRVLLDDTPTDSYQIISITPTEFTMRSNKGDLSTFVSAKDEELEAAP